MSYLLFLDESGHDHREAPYEVHGGIALHASQVWPFVQAVRALEAEAFGVPLHEFGTEIKGSKLLDKKRYEWAAQEIQPMPDIARRQHAKAFLRKGRTKEAQTRSEFTAYGQACLKMAKESSLCCKSKERCCSQAQFREGRTRRRLSVTGNYSGAI